MEGRLKTLDQEILGQQKRLDNLVMRLSDLPKEIPADQIYKQIQSLTEKVKELGYTKENLTREKNQMTPGVINQDQLMFRVRRTISNLEKVPVENRRPIYSNLIKFAELHPTKIKLGVYAPMERVGSCSVTSGAQVDEVDEPRTVVIFELTAYPEPKSLSSTELKSLYKIFGTYSKVAEVIGSSEAFVRQNVKSKKSNRKGDK